MSNLDLEDPSPACLSSPLSASKSMPVIPRITVSFGEELEYEASCDGLVRRNSFTVEGTSDENLESNKVKRLNSSPAFSNFVERHSAVHVSPQALSHMHKLHELLKARQAEGGSKYKILEDTSEEAMNGSWGVDGSWHIIGDLPRGKERPLNVRDFQVLPASAERSGQSLLNAFGVAAVNSKGEKGWNDQSIGQDCCSISYLPTGWEVFCLFDGHGVNGEWPAYRASRTLPYLLSATSACSTMLKQDKVEAALLHAFEKVQMDLVRESFSKDVELMVTGCTAACVMQHQRRAGLIWVATAGDSRAIMIVPGRGVVASTVDHKVNVKAERDRVEQGGMQVVTTHHEDGFVEERLMIKGEDYPGLCMTRSLGDLSVKDYGITAEPEVVCWRTDSFPEAYVLVASDGVWEFISSDDVAELVLASLASGLSVEKTCLDLVTHAQEAWKEKETDYVDDITVILLPVQRHSAQEAWSSALVDGGCCLAGLRRAGCIVS